jgi:drug/metabolite transporter (DMT)-like permease
VIWIPITVGAATLQVARNALQRGLLAGAGPWGATLVRFLFGLPFSLAFAAVAFAVWPSARPAFTTWFWLACAVGGVCQIAATAAMLVSMRRSTFALGTAFQQSSIPIAAGIGLVFREQLHPLAWAGLFLVTGGLFVLAWPRKLAEGPRDWTPALLGLVAGTGFAVSSNAYRQAALALDAAHPVLAALVCVFCVQALQTAALMAYLSLRDRRALRAVLAAWRSSVAAGFFGAAASGLWFTAFALAPAGPVRAVGVTEMPIAALAGRRLFAERLALWQVAAAAVAAVGVVLAALG